MTKISALTAKLVRRRRSAYQRYARGVAMLRSEPIRSRKFPEAERVWLGDKLISATCTTCGTLTDAENLRKQIGAVADRGLECRGCVAAKERKRRARNLEAERERGRVKYQKYRAEQLAYAKNYKLENAEVVAQRRQAYRVSNLEKLSAYQVAYRSSPEGLAKHRANNQRRRARRRNADCGCVSGEALRLIWESANGECAYCGHPAEHYDHLTALAVGGRHCVSNLVAACGPCNTKKGAKSLGEFFAYMEGTIALPAAGHLACPLLERSVA